MLASLRRNFLALSHSLLITGIGIGIGVAIFMAPVRAGAMPIVAFGDSLSDTGNVAILTRGAVPPPAFYFNGRFSNGPIWLDRIGAALGGDVDPRLAGGSNFAFGAARVTASPFVFSMRLQANAFLGATGAADPDNLYIVFGGGNDIWDAVGRADPIGAVTTAAQQLAGIVDDLANAGAVDIVVPSLPNVGQLPEARQAGSAVVNLATLLTQVFNQTLAQELAGIDASRDLNLIQPNFFGLLQTIVASPSSFGLTNVTDACVPATPFSVLPGTPVCSNPNQFLFWDLQHPTSVGHALFANAALDAIVAALSPTVAVPEPPPSALIAPLVLAGLLTTYRRRNPRPTIPMAVQ
jgi:outer membrane lipase/esterase